MPIRIHTPTEIAQSGGDFVTLEDCFVDSGEEMDYHTKYSGLIRMQPASEVPEACERCWRALEPAMHVWKPGLGHTSSINDIFLTLPPKYVPQMVHYHVYDDGRASVAWRIPFVNERPLFKSLMVALMVRNGLIDPYHKWQMLGRGAGPNLFDIFLWGCITEAEKECLERGHFPESLGIVGPPPAGLR